MKSINSEAPQNHWRYINVKNREVLDLGCGRWHWISPCPTTPEFFIQRGAKKVVGVDSNKEEIDFFTLNFSNTSLYEFIYMCIETKSQIEILYQVYKPQCVKCDIEEAEEYLLSLSDELFSLPVEYYIETHNKILYDKCMNKLSKNGYNIRNQLSHDDFEHCKVTFANKKEN